jgi:hypothetical protein
MLLQLLYHFHIRSWHQAKRIYVIAPRGYLFFK